MRIIMTWTKMMTKHAYLCILLRGNRAVCRMMQITTIKIIKIYSVSLFFLHVTMSDLETDSKKRMILISHIWLMVYVWKYATFYWSFKQICILIQLLNQSWSYNMAYLTFHSTINKADYCFFCVDINYISILSAQHRTQNFLLKKDLHKLLLILI